MNEQIIIPHMEGWQNAVDFLFNDDDNNVKFRMVVGFNINDKSFYVKKYGIIIAVEDGPKRLSIEEKANLLKPEDKERLITNMGKQLTAMADSGVLEIPLYGHGEMCGTIELKFKHLFLLPRTKYGFIDMRSPIKINGNVLRRFVPYVK